MNGIMCSFGEMLAGVCLSGLASCLLCLSAMWMAPVVKGLVSGILNEFHRSKGILITVPFVVACVMHGGSKGGGPNFIPNTSADDGIGLVGILVETNEVPDTVVSVFYTGGPVTESTPVSVRNFQTEAWTELPKTDCQYDSVGMTNIFQFVTAGTNWLHAAYWHVGTSKPPIVVTSSDIGINWIFRTSGFIMLNWTCTDANCTSFSVMSSEDGNSWELVGTTSETQFSAVGFLVGKTRYWKITSSYFREEQ